MPARLLNSCIELFYRRWYLGIAVLGLVAITVWVCCKPSDIFSLGRSAQFVENILKHPQDSLAPFGSLGRPTTILFMGTDVVYSGNQHHCAADRGACTGNSDTMLLVFVNPVRNQVSILHIPRDTEAFVGKWGIQKINSANPFGGPELAKATVAGLLGVSVDHYVVMNIQALVEMVNELGGVTVEIPKKMNYMDWTAKLKIDLEPGFHTLTGNQSMGFVRFRHDALGDIGRIQRQQIFLQAVWRRMMSPDSWLHVPALVGIAQQNLRTDLSQADIFQILNCFHSVPKGNVRFLMLPGEFAANGDWIAHTEARALAARLSSSEEDVAQSRRNISVCIVNASSDRTLGSKLAMSLHKLGYMTFVARDSQGINSTQTKIIAQDGNFANAKMIQQDLGNVGEVTSASTGVLMSSITLIVRNDIALDKITMSSVDAPYVAPVAAQALVSKIDNKLLNRSLDPVEQDGSGTSAGYGQQIDNVESAEAASLGTPAEAGNDNKKPNPTGEEPAREITPVPLDTGAGDEATDLRPALPGP